MDPNLIALESLGVSFVRQPHLRFAPAEWQGNPQLALDAQPGTVTTSNAGVPAFMTNYVDPKMIEILFAPMKAAMILGGEIKKGDWLSDTALFPVLESVGEVSSYGDFNENGHADANVNWVNRQSYYYQNIAEWGERELARMGLAKVDWANQKSIAGVLTLNKFQNLTYFFGVKGLLNYGLLNDPNLIAPIVPAAKAAGGVAWPNGTALEVYQDISGGLYNQLVIQTNSLVDLETPMKLIMTASSQVNLTKVTSFNVSVMDMLKKNFPNLTIETAPEYATASGNLVQLIVPEFAGQRTADVAFTEKLRAHPIVVGMSSFKQKKSQGTWGCIIYRPIFIAQLLGV